MNIGKYSHVTQALYDFHWLPVRARIHFKILVFAFKAIRGLAPTHILVIKLALGRSHLTMLDLIVVCYWSRPKRKCFLRLVPDHSTPLRHVCGIVCLLNCSIFNH